MVVDAVGLPGGVGQPYRARWLDMLAPRKFKVQIDISGLPDV